MGKLILPVGPDPASALVAAARAPGGVGRTIRWVERVDCPVPCLLGLSPVKPVRGTDIGWVIAAPAGEGIEGIKPVG